MVLNACCSTLRVFAVVFRDNVRRPLSVSVKILKTANVGALKTSVAALRPGMFGVTAEVPAIEVCVCGPQHCGSCCVCTV